MISAPKLYDARLNIAQLLPSLEIGGMERLAVDLGRRQVADGHRASIYCTRHAGQLASEAQAHGIDIRTFTKTDGPSLSLIYSLAKQLRRDRVDVLHAHNALVLHYGIAAARIAGVRVVINTRHGGNMNWDPKCERIWRLATRWADGVVFISEGVRDFYVERDRLALRNKSVIYNGIDLSKFRSRPAVPSSHKPHFRFGAVGRLVPAKDHVNLVRSFSLISGMLPEAQLHILGDGPCRNDIAKTVAQLGLSNRVVLHGAGHDVPGFLSTLDVFVLSSLDEGLPISLMEAMAAGLPVISTRLPGLIELAPESVVAGYCPPGRPELLADLMLDTARRSDLSTVGANAQQWAQRFAIEESWLQYYNLFRNALLRKRVLERPKTQVIQANPKCPETYS